jgi:hypothetical protein
LFVSDTNTIFLCFGFLLVLFKSFCLSPIIQLNRFWSFISRHRRLFLKFSCLSFNSTIYWTICSMISFLITTFAHTASLFFIYWSLMAWSFSLFLELFTLYIIFSAYLVSSRYIRIRSTI